MNIPPVRTSFNIEGQPIAIIASGVISRVSKDRNQEVFALKLSADLSDLQENITGLLRSQLDRSDRCGEHIAIQHATLTPADPASLLTTQLYYERWACAKAFGKQIVKKLVAGNGVVQIKLTPAVEDNKAVRLVPEIGTIEADGSLGELLRSGSIGAMLREKIGAGLVSSIQKATNGVEAALPPAVQSAARIQTAQFTNTGSGHLAVVLGGEIRISTGQAGLLLGQLKH